ncbi:MAG: succinylglutamate desuccinylase/aspartoacylase family protein [Patescibacteria group bacterium]
MDKRILFIAGTHGDEPIGSTLLKKLSNQGDVAALYESVIGNPRALAQNKRFIEADLNRAAPGDATSPVYEVARASELVELFKRFDYVVDFHETKANDHLVIIIPRLSRESLALALSFDIDKVLIWPPSSSLITTGPLVQCTPFGIEIECGTKSSFESTLRSIEEVTIKFLKNGVFDVDDNLSPQPTRMEQKKFYLVYGRIEPREIEGVDLQDFGMVDTGREKFIALLFGKHKGLTGYKMRALDSQKVSDMIASSATLSQT